MVISHAIQALQYQLILQPDINGVTRMLREIFHAINIQSLILLKAQEEDV